MSEQILVANSPEGLVGFAMADIGGIMPSLGNNDHSVIYTTIFPEGITVYEDSATLIGLWLGFFEVEDEEEEDGGE